MLACFALLMAWDFLLKGRPILPRFVTRWVPGYHAVTRVVGGAE